MNPLAAYGLLADALLFGALATLLPLGILRPKAALVSTTLALLVGLAPGVHGMFGTPSVTLLCLALLQLAGRTPAPLRPRPALALVAFACPFYACSWGLGPLDFYALGYAPGALLLALFPLGLVFWLRRWYIALLILTADLAAYATGLFPNLWDVLIDPLLLMLALTVLARAGWARFSARGNR